MLQQNYKVRKPLVIVVDDQEVLRLMLRALLRNKGFKVLLARSGMDALRIVSNFRGAIDLMITDVQMPGMSGFALAETVARTHPTMPVLFVSGGFNQDAQEVQDRMRVGRGFLEKPFNACMLSARVDALMSARQHQSAASADPRA